MLSPIVRFGEPVLCSCWRKPSSGARILTAVALLTLLFGMTMPNKAFAAKWDPVDPAVLSATDSSSFPGTDAEILFSRHELNERSEFEGAAGRQMEHSLSLDNYVRAKIYTAKGVQDRGKLKIRNLDDCDILYTEARVVKPNGTVIVLKKEDIVTNVLAKDKEGLVWKETSFVFPDLEPGDVVEYRWRERVVKEVWLRFWYTQEFVPIRDYTFTVASLAEMGSISWLNCPNVSTSEKNGFTLTVRNQTAFEEEPHMPPTDEVRGFLYIAKSFPQYRTDESVWNLLNEHWSDEFNDSTRPSSPVKKKAQALVEGAATDEEKLQRLYEFCQGTIYNTSLHVTNALREEVDKHEGEEANSPAKTLEKGHGRKDEINNLFAALARAQGYKVRLARNPSRGSILNLNGIIAGWAFLARTSVAVRYGDTWHYFNPGAMWVPVGMLDWRDQQQPALLCNGDKVEMATTPASPADKSQIQRKGRFTIDSEGTLEGDVVIAYTGHCAIEEKDDHWEESQEDTDKGFQKEITGKVPTAEISGISWDNLKSRLMPLTVKYHVKVPGYGQQAGKRLVFSPAYFQSGEQARFVASERKTPICFTYPWIEHDDVEIVLPEGYTLDKPTAPAKVGELTSAIGAAYELTYRGKTRVFGYKRDFVLGANGVYSFKKESYGLLKTIFEAIQKSDAHSIVIRPKAVAAPQPAGESAAPAGTAGQPAAAEMQK